MGSALLSYYSAAALALGLFLLPGISGGIEADDSIQAMEVEASLAAFHIRGGFRIELVAAEPLVMDPVALDWGPDGRLWVAEMADYPLGIDGKGKPGGRVRFLEDTDGDGRYDRSVVFLDGLNFPTGVKAWKDGVLVTAAPEILFAGDTNGDGRADVRKVLYKGFSEGNQQLRVNGLRWGLDNWIHCASGAHHGGYAKGNRVISLGTGKTIVLGSRDFRIRPDAGLLDPQSGPSQFGRNRDDWGNWFGVQNSHPLWHYVLRDHHLRRNPYFVSPNPKKQVVTPSNPRVYPAKLPQKRFHSFEQSGRFTSACSGMVYRDELLFSRGSGGHAFTCEPFHNVVQHNIISREGVTFTARRDPAESKLDFIASRDRWFRPVMVRTGPDGALWVVDMYRYMIEHPQWLPKNGQDELRPYYRHGARHGRIYRVFPASDAPRGWPRLQDSSPGELAGLLQHPNGWVRDTAQQLLVQGRGLKVVEELRGIAGDGRSALGRLHALCTLDGIGKLDVPTL
ncbi:MAG: PVC-type heme-binding CxxCH protein, partial [Planctomycetota bacterium]|nr:PVC-type heme-binding CxxCH protein [Planctomycetota bacterium]